MTDRAKKLAALDDYVAGQADGFDVDAFESSLFANPDDDELLFVDGLARASARIVALGALHPGVTRREIDALIAAGRRVDFRDVGSPRTYTVAPPAEDAEIVVQRADLGLRDIAFVDIEIDLPGVGHVKTLRDVKVDPDDGAVYSCCEATLFRSAMESERTIHRIVVVRNGERVTIATYEAIGPRP